MPRRRDHRGNSSDRGNREALRRFIWRDLAQVIDLDCYRREAPRRVLREIADHQVAMRFALAGKQVDVTHQRLHQRDFARTVATEQADTVARFQPEIDGLQNLRDTTIATIAAVGMPQAQQRMRQLGGFRES